MRDEKSPLPLGHDGYLKLWALSRPRLNYGYVMLDEAQDTNDVVIDMLQRQDCQIVYVGDRHQQIYEWRGAVNALDKLSTLDNCKLTKSFRFGQAIADVANIALHKLGETAQIVGNENVRSEIGPLTAPSAILARSNGMVLSAVIRTLENRMRPYVEGGTSDLSRLIQGYCDIRDRGFSVVPELYGFTSWDQVVEYSQTDCGSELSAFVGLIKMHGPEGLSEILERVERNANDAEVTVSTIHKAKGREWDSVCVEDDFSIRKAEGGSHQLELSSEDLRTLYVALTRAKKSLQLGDNVKRYLGL
jgi:superfamily I DNA/RNA helicase